MLVYKISLPPLGAPDVVKRIMLVKLDDVVQPDMELDVKAQNFEFNVADNVKVSLILKDTDDAGNDSPLSDELVFVSKDTLPPAAPNGLSVELVREEA
jgi:hypothetical protein